MGQGKDAPAEPLLVKGGPLRSPCWSRQVPGGDDSRVVKTTRPRPPQGPLKVKAGTPVHHLELQQKSERGSEIKTEPSTPRYPHVIQHAPT